jgi:hypothetical protein
MCHVFVNSYQQSTVSLLHTVLFLLLYSYTVSNAEVVNGSPVGSLLPCDVDVPGTIPNNFFYHYICNGFQDRKIQFVFPSLCLFTVFPLIHLREQAQLVSPKIKLLLHNTS